jgi:hypothetical protein
VATPAFNIFVSGHQLAAEVLAQLDRLEVRESEDEPSVAALRFGLAQSDKGEFAPLDDELFTPAAPLAVEITAPGARALRLFDGFVSHVRPHFEAIESNCYVEVMAMDVAMILDAEERTESYPDKTDADAARDVLNRYQLPSTIDSTNATHEEKRQLLVQRSSDWDFLRQLARRNGFVVYFEYDPGQKKVAAFFRRRPVSDPPQPDLAVLTGDANLNWIDLQLVSTGPVRHTGSSIDPIAKRLIRSDGSPVLAPLGDALIDGDIEGGLQQAGASATTALLRDPVPLDAAIADEGSGATDRDLFAVEARGELDPELYRGLLRARRPVLLRGVGRRFSGTYFVRTVRTTLEEGVLTQTFVAERNAIGVAGSEPFGESAEQVGPE